ncbi:MAG: hypothetical protein NZ743_03355 [Pseudomonadales bacterium]|nr:hypothetical protein [Pseudomonadales bacterium]
MADKHSDNYPRCNNEDHGWDVIPDMAVKPKGISMKPSLETNDLSQYHDEIKRLHLESNALDLDLS